MFSMSFTRCFSLFKIFMCVKKNLISIFYKGMTLLTLKNAVFALNFVINDKYKTAINEKVYIMDGDFMLNILITFYMESYEKNRNR